MAKKKTYEEPLNPLGWMVTFSDLVTLLLTFFVLLISMSSMDIKAVQESFGFFGEGSGPLEYSSSGRLDPGVSLSASPKSIPLDALMANKRAKDVIFAFDDLAYSRIIEMIGDQIGVEARGEALAITLANFILFEEGSARLRWENLPLLQRIASIIVAVGPGHPVSIEGHTDGEAAEGGNTAAAWELSLARAIAVLEYFTRDEGLPESIFRVGGLGPSRPIYPEDDPALAPRNRRIEILIYRR